VSGFSFLGRSRRIRNQRGAVAVEFALIAPIVLMLLFGMISGGRTYSDHLSITNAVREGARFGAAVDYTNSNWATSVRTRVQQAYFNAGDTLSNGQVCVSVVSNAGVTLASAAGTGCGAEPISPSSMATGSCVVKVWVRKPHSIVLVVAPPLNLQIGAQSVSYYGRSAGLCTAA
jgi:Flp pilus assembly protein TadG